MKKLLLVILIIALGYLTWNTVTKGFQIEQFELDIPSYIEIKNNNEKLDGDISDLDALIEVSYADALTKVTSSKADFNVKKDSYDSLAANATDEQLEAAMREEEFLLDYLWILVGNYANDNNVKFLMNVNDDFSIDFDITGSYISIINFIYDLTNDPELRFSVDNIELQGGNNHDATTKAKFSVYGINVVTKSEFAEPLEVEE